MGENNCTMPTEIPNEFISEFARVSLHSKNFSVSWSGGCAARSSMVLADMVSVHEPLGNTR